MLTNINRYKHFWIVFVPLHDILLSKTGNALNACLNTIQPEYFLNFFLISSCLGKDSVWVCVSQFYFFFFLRTWSQSTEPWTVASSSEILSLPHMTHALLSPLHGDSPGLSPHSLAAGLCDLGQVTAPSEPQFPHLLKAEWIKSKHEKRLWSRWQARSSAR